METGYTVQWSESGRARGRSGYLILEIGRSIKPSVKYRCSLWGISDHDDHRADFVRRGHFQEMSSPELAPTG